MQGNFGQMAAAVQQESPANAADGYCPFMCIAQYPYLECIGRIGLKNPEYWKPRPI